MKRTSAVCLAYNCDIVIPNEVSVPVAIVIIYGLDVFVLEGTVKSCNT